MQMTHRVRTATATSSMTVNKYLYLLINSIFLAMALMVWSGTAAAQIARVLDIKGTALVERSGQVPRLLGAGEQLSERDVINVARNSWAILEFNDQTRITLRPNTVFRLDSYRADAPETMLLGLVKGGLRVVTGLFGKRNPQGVKFQTAVATIGIRGTEFDARLCAEDCAAEEKAAPAPRPVVLPVARVVEMNGVVSAGRAGETLRQLVPGAMLNEGDDITTGRDGNAVLFFRDGARVSLAAGSRMRINNFSFDLNDESGNAILALFVGNIGIQTGRLAKVSPSRFRIFSPIGEIKPRGTTFLVMIPQLQSTGVQQVAGSAQQQSSSSQQSANISGVPVSPEMLAFLDSMIEKVNENAGVQQILSRMAASHFGTEPLAGLNLQRIGSATTVNELLILMRGWHADLTRHPNYGDSLLDLPLPTLAEITDPSRLTAVVQSWFTKLDENPGLGSNFEQLDARVIGVGQPPPGTPQVAVNTSRVTVDVRQRVPAESLVRVDILDSGVAGVLRRLETVIEENASRGILVKIPVDFQDPSKGTKESVMPGSVHPINLPAIPVNATHAEALKILQQWYQEMAGHPVWGKSLAGMQPPTAADVRDPGRMGALLSQWFVQLDGSRLGDGLETFDTAGLFVNPLGPQAPNPIAVLASVAVSDGAVDVVSAIGTSAVESGSVLVVDRSNRSFKTEFRMPDGMFTSPDSVKVDTNIFKNTDRAVEEGLYVWVRDGAVQVAKDDKSVDVPAGNAAVATKDKVELLDVVPNFLRFDQTPRPVPSGGSTVIDTFRAGDGAIINMCVIR